MLPSTQIWAIGDVHGDLAVTQGFLQRVGLVDKRDRYTRGGPGKIVVFVGDIIDGHRSAPIPDETNDLRVLFYLLELSNICKLPDQILLLSGNHELMNFSGRFDYALSDDMEKRKEQFERGGTLANQFARFLPALRLVDGILFSHASIDVATLNSGWGSELKGQALVDAVNKSWQTFLTCPGSVCEPISRELYDLFWSRTNVSKSCPEVEAVLERFGATKMVSGHMPAKSIRERCDRRMFLVDAMASAAFDSSGSRDSLLRLR